MVRLVHCTVPRSELNPTLEVLSHSPHVHSLATFYGDGICMITFKSDERKLQGTLRRLGNIGVGVRYGSIDVVGLVTTLPPLKRTSTRRYRIDDRMSVEEIKDAIDMQGRMNFDFLAMTSIAAVMSGSGLVGDSGTTVVASMLVSPLMGPLLCLTFGLTSWNDGMIKKGLINLVIGTTLCFCIGAAVGIASAPYYKDLIVPSEWEEFVSNDDLAISSEMIERGTPGSLLMGFAIAVPSGVGVTLAVTTSGGINALVGVAISAALVPPVVNSGICVVTGIILSFFHGRGEEGGNFLTLGGVSSLLFLINIITMTIVGIGTMKLKKVTTEGGRGVKEEWDGIMQGRGSFLRAGVEMRSKDEMGVDATSASSPSGLGSPLLSGNVSTPDRGGVEGLGGGLKSTRTKSNSYTGWWGTSNFEEEEEGDDDEEGDLLGTPSKGRRQNRNGRVVASFMRKASETLGIEERRRLHQLRIMKEEEERRDSVDVFSPNNFASDLREAARSITEREEGENEGGEEGMTLKTGTAGGGFRLDKDLYDDDDDDGVGKDGDGGGYVDFGFVDPLRS